MKKAVVLAVMLGFSLLLGGCVSLGRFEQKEQEAQTLGDNLKALQQQHADLVKERDGLKGELAKLGSERDALVKEKTALTGERDALTKEKARLLADNRELEKVLKAKSDTLSQNIAELRQRITALENENQKLQETVAAREKENAGLHQDIDDLRKRKEEEVQKTSKTYEDLLDKMKGEISKGEVTISELKGKLTVNMVEAILFDSGRAVVKPEGLKVLQKVIDILKGVTDKAIRIEGHTDNVPIHTAQFPSNWELSAARATNVARFLQQQGIDPTILAAVAYGEYKPVAENDTKEGRAKNRRIEIILVPKD
ncbi:MAG TPA: OmpA family protein [Geobacteraceae bacterium]